MDMRSFHLNFEVNAFLYDTDSIRKLVQDFKDDLEESSEIHVDRFHKRRLHRRIVESTYRLLSPFIIKKRCPKLGHLFFKRNL